MATAEQGKTVKVHYTGSLEDGTVFDSSEGRQPLEFTIGAGQVIPGFEQAVMGMNEGESKTENLPADQAYGQRREDLVLELDRNQIPENLNPEVGQQLQLHDADGNTIPVVVREVSDSTITLDANHPLAGQDLTFEIELVKVSD